MIIIINHERVIIITIIGIVLNSTFVILSKVICINRGIFNRTTWTKLKFFNRTFDTIVL